MSDLLSNLIITKVYSAITLYNDAGEAVTRKDRSSWAVIIKYEGETIYYSKGQENRSNAGNIVILPKGSNYKWQCVKPGHYGVIEFESEPIIDQIFTFPVKNSDKLLSIFRSTEQRRLTKKDFYQIESIKNTYAIILELLRSTKQTSAHTTKEAKLRPAIHYIAKHYTEKINNETLAEKCGISTVYFRKLFTETYKVSPINYIINLRIKKAKEMLQSDYSTITDIAVSLGYQSIYDFSRDFKKHTGLAPSKYIVASC